ncbi:MAG: hypothetical protein ACLP7Q_08415 [Isosphaeraceae bacterium]
MGRVIQAQTRLGRSKATRAAVLLFALLISDAVVTAEPPAQQSTSELGASSPAGSQVSISVEQLARRLQALEEHDAKLTEKSTRLAEQNAGLSQENAKLAHQLEQVTAQYHELNQRLDQLGRGVGQPLPQPLPPPAEPKSPVPKPVPDSATAARMFSQPGTAFGPPESSLPPLSRFLVGAYDEDRGQFVLVRPHDEQRVPFELRADFFTQARYINFARSTGSWIDSTGARLPVQSFDSVEINRNFIQFSGFALDPRLQFTVFLFSSTALNDTVYLGWINYRFSKAFDLRVGNWAVPGTREWYESFRYTLGAERLMATTFFRPNISPGVWAQGEPIESLHYVAMLANSLNRFSQGINRVGWSAAFGGTLWWEPTGDFGRGPSDIENHQVLSPRLGMNLALSREANQGATLFEQSNPEDTIVRLSNGTPLFRAGALGPGVELISTDVQLWTVDAALKYRGLSVSGEYFFRWLDNFKPLRSQVPFNSLFDNGGLLQASYFLVPGKLETFGRTSFVTSRFGGGNEFGGGLNWYPLSTREWRFTFEVLQINHSPAQNILTGYRAGESGTLFQLQWFSDF